jgi:hypothetical protein
VVKDDREDGREATAVGGLADELLPDPDDVEQEPEGHEGVVRRLVLEEEVEEDLDRLGLVVTAGATDGVEEVGVPAAEAVVDVAARDEAEGAPGDAGRERRVEQVTELAGSVLGVGEDGLDEGVVRGGGLHGGKMPEAGSAGIFLETAGLVPSVDSSLQGFATFITVLAPLSVQ